MSTGCRDALRAFLCDQGSGACLLPRQLVVVVRLALCGAVVGALRPVLLLGALLLLLGSRALLLLRGVAFEEGCTLRVPQPSHWWVEHALLRSRNPANGAAMTQHGSAS